jgi:hypothetical protein
MRQPKRKVPPVSHKIRYAARTTAAAILVPVMKITGFRFDKNYRHGTTRRHAMVYAWVDTVKANIWAGL